MPLSADPSATCLVCLRSDEAVPEDQRPAFTARFLTRKQAGEIRRTVDQADKATDDGECFRLLWAAISIGVVGWVNFADADGKPLEFNAENVSEKLTDLELWELAINLPSRVSMQEVDRRPLASRSPGGGGESAPGAAAIAAASTSPAKPNRS